MWIAPLFIEKLYNPSFAYCNSAMHTMGSHKIHNFTDLSFASWAKFVERKYILSGQTVTRFLLGDFAGDCLASVTCLNPKGLSAAAVPLAPNLWWTTWSHPEKVETPPYLTSPPSKEIFLNMGWLTDTLNPTNPMWDFLLIMPIPKFCNLLAEKWEVRSN